MTILELREKRNTAWNAAKAFLESHRTDKGTLSAEDDATYNRMEEEINAFIPEEYWNLDAHFRNGAKEYSARFFGNAEGKITVTSAEENAKIRAELDGKDYIVKSLKEQEKVTMRDLLYALVLHNANDAAIAIAEHISGNMMGFLVLMNDRVQQIGNSASRLGRKIVVEGRSMVNIITTASELGYITIPENTLIDIEQLKNYPPEQTVLITTGSQGETMAALSRMAAGMHRKVTINKNDTIILSSTPIPGNEKAVARVINELAAKGAKVINQDTHVSGHACREELKLIYSLVNPKYAIPVHGEYRHLQANADIAASMGIPEENVFIMNCGDVLEFGDETAGVVGHVQTGGILVDGLGVGDVGNIVLRDRQTLAKDGIIIVVMTINRYTCTLLAGPDIVSRGFVYVRESDDLMDESHGVVANAVEVCLSQGVCDWGKIKTIVRDNLSDFLWKKMKRRPMIIPIIMEVDL